MDCIEVEITQLKEAIEKQTATPTVNFNLSLQAGGRLYSTDESCPRCGALFEEVIDDWIEYCPNCGQKLIRAWRDCDET